MDFRLRTGEWNHPDYPRELAGISVSQGEIRFRISRLTGGPSPALVFMATLALSVVILVVCWFVFKALVFVALFIPPLALAALRPLAGRPQLSSETIAVPVARLRSIGGGGDVVAFAIDLPAPAEVAVLLRMVDAGEAERLRIELLRV